MILLGAISSPQSKTEELSPVVEHQSNSLNFNRTQNVLRDINYCGETVYGEGEEKLPELKIEDQKVGEEIEFQFIKKCIAHDNDIGAASKAGAADGENMLIDALASALTKDVFQMTEAEIAKFDTEKYDVNLESPDYKRRSYRQLDEWLENTPNLIASKTSDVAQLEKIQLQECQNDTKEFCVCTESSQVSSIQECQIVVDDCSKLTNIDVDAMSQSEITDDNNGYDASGVLTVPGLKPTSVSLQTAPNDGDNSIDKDSISKSKRRRMQRSRSRSRRRTTDLQENGTHEVTRQVKSEEREVQNAGVEKINIFEKDLNQDSLKLKTVILVTETNTCVLKDNTLKEMEPYAYHFELPDIPVEMAEKLEPKAETTQGTSITYDNQFGLGDKTYKQTDPTDLISKPPVIFGEKKDIHEQEDLADVKQKSDTFGQDRQSRRSKFVEKFTCDIKGRFKKDNPSKHVVSGFERTEKYINKSELDITTHLNASVGKCDQKQNKKEIQSVYKRRLSGSLTRAFSDDIIEIEVTELAVDPGRQIIFDDYLELAKITHETVKEAETKEDQTPRGARVIISVPRSLSNDSSSVSSLDGDVDESNSNNLESESKRHLFQRKRSRSRSKRRTMELQGNVTQEITRQVKSEEREIQNKTQETISSLENQFKMGQQEESVETIQQQFGLGDNDITELSLDTKEATQSIDNRDSHIIEDTFSVLANTIIFEAINDHKLKETHEMLSVPDCTASVSQSDVAPMKDTKLNDNISMSKSKRRRIQRSRRRTMEVQVNVTHAFKRQAKSVEREMQDTTINTSSDLDKELDKELLKTKVSTLIMNANKCEQNSSDNQEGTDNKSTTNYVYLGSKYTEDQTCPTNVDFIISTASSEKKKKKKRKTSALKMNDTDPFPDNGSLSIDEVSAHKHTIERTCIESSRLAVTSNVAKKNKSKNNSSSIMDTNNSEHRSEAETTAKSKPSDNKNSEKADSSDKRDRALSCDDCKKTKTRKEIKNFERSKGDYKFREPSSDSITTKGTAALDESSEKQANSDIGACSLGIDKGAETKKMRRKKRSHVKQTDVEEALSVAVSNSHTTKNLQVFTSEQDTSISGSKEESSPSERNSRTKQRYAGAQRTDIPVFLATNIDPTE